MPRSIFARKQNGSQQWGLIIDGSTVYGVSVEDGQVTARHLATGDTPADAVAAFWSEAKPKGQVIAALLSRDIVPSNTSIPAVPENVRKSALAAHAHENLRLSGEEVSAAGKMVKDSETDLFTSIIPIRDISPFWSREYSSQLSLTPLGFSLPRSGLWLYVGYNYVQLDLVIDGTIRDSRLLEPSGLDGLKSQLSASHSSGDERLLNVRQEMGDPEAIQTVQQWSMTVARAARETIEYWRPQHHDLPYDLQFYLYGPGSTFNDLEVSLTNAQLPPSRPALPDEVTSVFRSNLEQHEWIAPVMLATYHPDILATFENPAADEAKRKAAAALQRSAIILKTVAVTAAATAALTVPVFMAEMSKRSAENERDDLQTQITGPLADEYEVFQTVQSREKQGHSAVRLEPEWSSILERLNETKPADVIISTLVMNMEGENIVVVVTGTGGPDPFRDFSLWLEAAAEEFGATNLFAPSATVAQDRTTFEMSFTIPPMIENEEGERVPNFGELREFTVQELVENKTEPEEGEVGDKTSTGEESDRSSDDDNNRDTTTTTEPETTTTVGG